MRVVVAGGAGFLGSHLCRALLARSDEVVCMDNLITGDLENVSELFSRPDFSFVHQDVSEFVHVSGHVDAVMNLASPASPVDYLELPIQTLKVGALGTHHLLGLAKDKNARFFLASTSEVYGDPHVHPQTEDYWGHVNPVGPRGVYDEAKRFAEAMTMAYHRYHGVDVRIVRIFNSVLADEQVLYDDGRELRRETAAEVAARLAGQIDLEGWAVPAFGASGTVTSAEASAFIGHPTTARCFEVRTVYGRSVHVTGDHSLFVEGPNGEPEARPVVDLKIGDHIAIAGRVAVPERDRLVVRVTDVLDACGIDPWDTMVRAEDLGQDAWAQRESLFAAWQEARPATGPTWRSHVWSRIDGCRKLDQLPLGGMRKIGMALPAGSRVRPRGAGNAAELPQFIEVTDELLWLLGLYVAEGCRYEEVGKSAFISISCDDDTLDRAEKIIARDLNLHSVRAPKSDARSASLFAHSTYLLLLLDHLGFTAGDKCIPGWVLGLPLDRLKWFIEGYREGDGAHSGDKFKAQVRHEFSTTSTRLKDDLIVAFGRFGLVPSVGKHESTFKQRTGGRRCPSWRLALPAVDPWSPLDWDRGVTQRLQSRRHGDLVWARVKEIVEVEATDLVYDFSVPGLENFYAGTGVMCHNTYGERMRPNDGRVVSNLLVQGLSGKPLTIYGDGSQTRSFCYVDDEIRGFLALLDSDTVGPVNIGNPNEFTIKELAELVIELTGTDAEIRYEPLPTDDPAQRRPDITLARTALGWEPQIQLREGLARTAEWFKTKIGADRG